MNEMTCLLSCAKLKVEGDLTVSKVSELQTVFALMWRTLLSLSKRALEGEP